MPRSIFFPKVDISNAAWNITFSPDFCYLSKIQIELGVSYFTWLPHPQDLRRKNPRWNPPYRCMSPYRPSSFTLIFTQRPGKRWGSLQSQRWWQNGDGLPPAGSDMLPLASGSATLALKSTVAWYGGEPHLGMAPDPMDSALGVLHSSGCQK